MTVKVREFCYGKPVGTLYISQFVLKEIARSTVSTSTCVRHDARWNEIFAHYDYSAPDDWEFKNECRLSWSRGPNE